MLGKKVGVRFAVLLAAYNGKEYIEEQIDTILQQESVEVHIFVSVDLSSDGTEALLADMATREPRLTLLPIGQRFGGAAPNFYRLFRDVDLVGFDYVSFADQDDLWHPLKLWNAHSRLLASDSAGYSSNVTAFWTTGKVQEVNKAQPQRRWDFCFEASGPGCTYVLNRDLALSFQEMVRHAGDALERVGYHDWLIYAFARSDNQGWFIDQWSSMRYRQHANNQIGVNSGWRSYWRRVRRMLDGHGFEQALLISGLVKSGAMPVVKRGLRGGRLGYLWLALRAPDCRRKRLDQLWFFILCVLFAMKPRHFGSAR